MIYFRINDKAVLDQFEKLIKEVDSIRSKRNTFIHSLYRFDDQTKTASIFKLASEKSIELSIYELNLNSFDEIDKLNKNIIACIKAFNRLNTKIKKLSITGN